MFPMATEGLASIGDQNVMAARKALQECRIPIVFEDTGGTRGGPWRSTTRRARSR